DRVLARFEGIPETLAEHPLIGRSREELAPDLRSLPVGNSIIYYRPLDNGFEVVRVLNYSRDLGFIF
ncbi:MAG: type II toxin-antitoxin system RelE/ParE family toxin, partial [Chloroflexi bacterium]|nr:type II toxin-antitoxin system RelE/ParE family toxin [Chloroflexota bacterium]